MFRCVGMPQFSTGSIKHIGGDQNFTVNDRRLDFYILVLPKYAYPFSFPQDSSACVLDCTKPFLDHGYTGLLALPTSTINFWQWATHNLFSRLRDFFLGRHQRPRWLDTLACISIYTGEAQAVSLHALRCVRSPTSLVVFMQLRLGFYRGFRTRSCMLCFHINICWFIPCDLWDCMWNKEQGFAVFLPCRDQLATERLVIEMWIQ